MCQGPFFHHKGAFNKNALLFLEIWLLLAETYCPKVQGPHFIPIMIKFLGVKKQIFVIFPQGYTVKLVYVVTKYCHKGSPLFSVFGHTYTRSSPQSPASQPRAKAGLAALLCSYRLGRGAVPDLWPWCCASCMFS